MNRRDFLFFRTTPRGRTLELSCRTLYMRYLDCQHLARSAADEPVADYEPWMGEPPAVFETRSADDLVRQVELDLREVEVLRVVDGEWIAATPLHGELEPVLASFRSRGGRVEFA